MTDPPVVSTLQARGRPPALFCIAGVEAYQALADGLAPELPVYGVFLPVEQQMFERSRSGRPRERLSVAETASAYLRLVRGRQPAGPYRLLGFSFAGVVAYEMAQQLHRLGEPVEMLVMLDIWLPSAVAVPRLRAALSRAKTLGWQSSDYLSHRLGRHARSAAHQTSRFDRFRERIVLNAIDRYPVRPYGGPVLVVRAQDSVASLGNELSDPTYGWGRHVARLQTVDVPGDHVGILKAPNVGALAHDLRRRLRRQAA